MADFSQQNSPLRVFTPLPEDTLLATSMSGREEMGGSYSFRVNLLAKAGTPVDFSKLLGAEARVELTLPGGATRNYSGIIGTFGQRDSDEVFDRYTMTLVPATHYLTLVRRSRVFQNLSATEIIDRILQPIFARSGRKSSNFAGNTPVRVCCTQYRETDWDFLRRLCAESGATYFWIHQPDQRVFQICDNSAVGAPDLGEIPFRKTTGGTEGATRIHDWHLNQSLCPPTVEVMDRNFQISGQEIRASATAPAQVQAGELLLGVPGGTGPWQQDELDGSRFFDSVSQSGGEDADAIPGMFSSAQPQANVGLRAAMAGSVRAQVVGNCCQLTPGHKFRLAGHPNQDGDWLVFAAEHTVEVEGRFWSGEAAVLKAQVRAECAPLALRQAIWPIPPRPAIAGVLTGVVIGPPGEEICIDRFGRVQVRFWWDREETSTSCWIRVAQAWAGNGWGAMFWPRVGHEVVVAFENGDPDRPIIVGSVYNSKNMPPCPLPGQAYTAGFKSCSQAGDPSANYNHILIQDNSGNECLWLHAEKHLRNDQEKEMTVKNPKTMITFHGM